MIDWLSVLILIGAGIVLVLLEIIFVPGTTILGIIGMAIMIFGIILAYSNFGPQYGTVVLVGTLIAGGVLTVFGFRQGSWKKFALKSAIRSRFNEDVQTNLFVDDEGKAVSALRPIGKAEFGDRTYEVRTIGNYVNSGTRVKVTRIDDQKRIFVEPIN
jgi:membrane-bound ClpP family serine protease